MNIFRHIDTPFGSIVYGIGAGPDESDSDLTRVTIHAYPCGTLKESEALGTRPNGDVLPDHDALYAEGAREGRGSRYLHSVPAITVNGKDYASSFTVHYTPGKTTHDGRAIGATLGQFDEFTPAARAKLTAWFEENWESIASLVAIATAIEDSAARSYGYAREEVVAAQRKAQDKADALVKARGALYAARQDEARTAELARTFYAGDVS